MIKWVIAGLVAIGGIAALLLIEREPKTAAEAVQRAEKKLLTLTANATRLDQEAVLDRFRFVGTKWPADPETPKCSLRIAGLLRQWNRTAEAFDAYKALGTADGLLIAADIKPEEAMALFEEFLKKFPADPRADQIAWQIIELKVAVGIDKYAPADIMDAANLFIVTYPKSPLREKAMLLLADTLRSIKEYSAALKEYDRIIEEFEGKPVAAKALLEKGKLLAEQMDKKKEAAEALKDLEKKHPDSPEAREGRGVREKAEDGAAEEEAEQKEKEFLKERYGLPGGDMAGAASIPRGTPADFLKALVEQQIDAIDYEIEVVPKPSDKTMTAAATIRLRNDGDEKSGIRMLIEPAMKITRAAVGATELKFQQTQGPVLIALAVPLKKGEEIALVVEWSGKEAGDTTPLRLRESGYAAPGAMWYPVTFPGDLHTGRIKVKGHDCHAVDASRPGIGLFFAYGAYKTLTKGKVTYLTIDGPARAAKVVDAAIDIIAYYESQFGPLPTPMLRLIDAELPSFLGGTSPSGLIFLNREFMEADPDPVSLIAHEIAHQWWGNLVPISPARPDYTPWLSEGLASHSDALYLEHRFGKERGRQHLEKGCLLYLERTMHLRDDAVMTCWPGHAEYTAVVYMKGASLLEMLRHETGPAYFPGLRRYATDCAGKSTGVADFRTALEAESRRDLKPWFAQWVERPGFPRLAVKIDGTTLSIRQEQKELFTLKLEVEIDGKVSTFDVAKAEETFPLPVAPAKVVLDPAGKIIKRPGTCNEWVKQ